LNFELDLANGEKRVLEIKLKVHNTKVLQENGARNELRLNKFL